MVFNQKEFGKRVQRLRRNAEMTQEQLAEVLRIDRTHIAKMETGQRACSIDMLLDFSELFNVSTDYLLKGIGNLDSERKWLIETAEKLKLLSSKI